MRWTLAPALLAALVLTGCATTTASKDAARAAQETRSAVALAQALRLVETGSPSTLRQAAGILGTDDARSAPNAPVVTAAARLVFDQLYPELTNPFPAVPPQPVGAQVSPFLSRVLPVIADLHDGSTLDGQTIDSLLQDLSDADSLDRDSVLPPYLSGLLVQRRSGTNAEARASFEESLRRAADFYPAAPRIAGIIIEDGTAATEIETLRRLAGLLPTAPQRYAALARADLAAGQPGPAADAAAQGLLVAPQDAQFALLRAQALAAQGDWYPALRVLDSLLKLKPDEQEALLLKARLLWEKAGDSAQALRTLTDAEAQFPTDPAFVELQGSILLATGKGQEGVTALKQALVVAPGRVSTLSLLLGQAVDAGRWDEALSWLAQIPDASRSARDMRLAWQAATGKGDHAQALDLAKGLAALQPGPDATALEARSLLSLDQKSPAMQMIDSALPAATDGALRSELFLLRSRADSDDPLRDLRSALNENPDNGEALTAIAELFAMQKDYRKAMEYARRAAVLAPDNRALVKRMRELEALAAAGQ